MLEVPPQGPEQQQPEYDELDEAMMDDEEREALRGCRYLLPKHATWFSFFGIHAAERKALAEFAGSGAADMKVGGCVRFRCPRVRGSGAGSGLKDDAQRTVVHLV